MNKEQKEQFFKVALCSSLVLFGFDGENLSVLIHPKKQDPFKGGLVLPSKYIGIDQSPESNVRDLMRETIGISEGYIEQLKAFAKVFRNPLGRVVNISYYAFVKLDVTFLEAQEAQGYKWVLYDDVPDLAFDHNEIINYAKERLKRRVKRRPVGFNLLPKEFTIFQLQRLYESALGKTFDKRNFRKKIFNSNLIAETGNVLKSPNNKKASKLYSFDLDKYDKMSLKGYDFLF